MSKMLLMLTAPLILAGCDCEDRELPADQSDQVIIAQGVWGHTWFWEGWPTASDGCPAYPRATPISATVVVYPPFPLDPYRDLILPYPGTGLAPRQVIEAEFRVQPVATSISTPLGFFEIPLEPGDYSLLILFGDELYAPQGQPVYLTVHEGEVTFSDFQIREMPEG